ncbi:MAG TPA: hypothetical protein VK797_03510 [Tepidisphaeraceae bacterium]|jgi:hypothetical protein|nr:hypothetical protein [Tepidisphaeraceae bacterium]
MTDRGEFIAVEIAEAERQFPALLKVVEEEGRIVKIVRNGKPIAELARSAEGSDLPMFPELAGVVFHADPTAPLDNEDWPETSR